MFIHLVNLEIFVVVEIIIDINHIVFNMTWWSMQQTKKKWVMAPVDHLFQLSDKLIARNFLLRDLGRSIYIYNLWTFKEPIYLFCCVPNYNNWSNQYLTMLTKFESFSYSRILLLFLHIKFYTHRSILRVIYLLIQVTVLFVASDLIYQ